jgi:alpha-amylase
MMLVSQRLQQLREQGYSENVLADARRELYRGQCNCSYWHGAFGGAYLPHLRNAVYNHLIAADSLLDQVLSIPKSSIEGVAGDFNLDGRPEIQLRNDKLICLLAPAQGGLMYELDVRTICHNLQATLDRRPEAYHRKVLAGQHQQHGDVASIHDRVVFKQAGLDERVQYDHTPRKSLLDHFFVDDAQLRGIVSGQTADLGDFVGAAYEARLRRNPDRVQAQLHRDGRVGDLNIRITKGVTLNAERSMLEIAYLLEGLPQDRTLHFGVEFNFAGLPAGADDRYFQQGDQRLGELGSQLDLQHVHHLALTDEWLGMSVHLNLSQAAGVWTFPIATVSQSEGGFELVHQSVAVIPHWHVRGDEHGRWSMTLHLDVDTHLAESRMEAAAASAH